MSLKKGFKRIVPIGTKKLRSIRGEMEFEKGF